jgi:hypothetical protein
MQTLFLCAPAAVLLAAQTTQVPQRSLGEPSKFESFFLLHGLPHIAQVLMLSRLHLVNHAFWTISSRSRNSQPPRSQPVINTSFRRFRLSSSRSTLFLPIETLSGRRTETNHIDDGCETFYCDARPSRSPVFLLLSATVQRLV